MIKVDTESVMAYYWVNRRRDRTLELPMRSGPVRFAVQDKSGRSSNSWRIWIGSDGSGYISCRDNMKELKVSLHASGAHHIAFTSESGQEMAGQGRFWDTWIEPLSYDGTPMVPTFALFFPIWALPLTAANRASNPACWDRNDFCLEAPDHPKATIVNFYVVNSHLEMRSSDFGEPCAPLAILPLRPGKTLAVIARFMDQGNMPEMAQSYVDQIDRDESWVKRLKDYPPNHVFAAVLSGTMTDGGAFLFPFFPQKSNRG